MFGNLARDCVSEECEKESDAKKRMNFKLDAVLETPVIMFPRNTTSSEMLSVHLGKIVITNLKQSEDEQQIRSTDSQGFSDVILVEFKDISMYSMNLSSTSTNASTSEAEKYPGIPIIHNTTLELLVQTTGSMLTEQESLDFSNFSNIDVGGKKFLQITGQVSPLKVVLTKHIHEQILKTLDNITPNSDFHSDSTVAGEQASHGSGQADASVGPDPSAAKSDDAAKSDSDALIVKANFKLPVLNIIMRGERECACDLVNLKFENFYISALNVRWFCLFEICLESLAMEDLLQDQYSRHRYLMVSHGPDRGKVARSDISSKYMSRSCPSSVIDIPLPSMPSSLPTSLNFHQNVFAANAEFNVAPRLSVGNKR